MNMKKTFNTTNKRFLKILKEIPYFLTVIFFLIIFPLVCMITILYLSINVHYVFFGLIAPFIYYVMFVQTILDEMI